MATTAIHRDPVADLLLKEGWIDRKQYDRAMREYERTRRSIIRIFTDMGALDEEKRMNVLARTMHCKVVSLREVTPRPEVAGYLTREVCRSRVIVPLQFEESGVIVAMNDPSDVRTISDLEKIFGRSVRPVLAPAQEILDAIHRLPEESSQSGAELATEHSLGYRLMSGLTLPLLVFVPIVIFYWQVNTAAGAEWYGQFGFSTFENILVFMVVWGSWAAVAYFINDLIFGKPAKK